MSARLEGVSKRYGTGRSAVQALVDLDLDAADGELLVLVGPSGSGKSTALRVLAGLETPSDGRVLIDGRDVTRVPPQRRDVAMVFQDYALYPHLTVAENLAFGMRIRRTPAAEARRRTAEVATQLGIGELLDRSPEQLSGGQRQRVALGRAMVREPALYLMDEPLSNLDAQLRIATRAEIVELHRRLGRTTVYVTHDQSEAMTMGDRVAVLAEGRLQQVAAPQEVYDRPANVMVAAFVGSPAMNLVDGGGVLGGAPGTVIGVRPEDLVLEGHADEASVVAPDQVDVTVVVVEPLGSETVLAVRCADGTPLSVRRPPRAGHRVGERLRLRVLPDHRHTFDAATGAARR